MGYGGKPTPRGYMWGRAEHYAAESGAARILTGP
jgi:hypothetical protein